MPRKVALFLFSVSIAFIVSLMIEAWNGSVNIGPAIAPNTAGVVAFLIIFFMGLIFKNEFKK